MIDSMFQPGTDQALNDQVRRPRVAQPDAPGFSFADLAKSPFQGIGGAVAGGIAFGSEIAGAFGQVMGGAGTDSAGGMFSMQSDKERADSEAQRRKMMVSGVDYSNEAGDIFRARAKTIMPDPQTTHASAQVVAGLFQFGAQAVGYGLTLGPMGPLALAGDVGLSEADRLKQQGVDIDTRTKAGAVAGVVAGASVVIPMTGATALSRAAKGIAVGEGSMVGQSLAERAILKAAGYDKIADTFDPLDPVMLGLGLVPGALGAKFGRPAVKARELPPGSKALEQMGLGERQALRYDDVRLDAYAVQAAQRQGIPPEVLLAVKNAGEKSGPTATSPAGAQGVMQFMPKTWREFGKGDPTDPMLSIDAGAAYLKKLHDAYGDWDAAVAHYNGGGAQAAIVRGGGKPTIPETAKYLERVKAYLGNALDERAAAAVKADPELVAAARVSQAAAAVESSRLTPDTDLPGRDAHLSAVEMAADQLGRGERVSVADVVGEGQRIQTLDDFLQRNRIPAEAPPPDVQGNFISWVLQKGGIDFREKFDITGERGGIAANPGGVFRKGGMGVDELARMAEAEGYLPAGAVDSAGDNGGARAMADLLQRATNGERILSLQEQVQKAARDQYDGEYTRRLSDVERRLQVLGVDTAPAKGNAPALEAYERAHRPALLAAAISEVRSAERVVDATPEFAEMQARAQQVVDDIRMADITLAEHEANAGPLSPVMRRMVSDMLGEDAAARGSDATAKPEAPAAQSTLDRAAAEVSMLNPDLLVQLDGMAEPVRVGDLLDAVKAEAANDARDGRLLEVAAACALRN